MAVTLQTQKGWRRASQVLTLRGVVPDPPGVEEVATGRFQLLCWNQRTPIPLEPTVLGHDHASVREGGRRRRSSHMPSCQEADTVKDPQA